MNTLIFGVATNPTQGLPDLTANLRQQLSADIRKEGVHKRFNVKPLVSSKELIKSHASEQLLLQDSRELKKYFKAINKPLLSTYIECNCPGCQQFLAFATTSHLHKLHSNSFNLFNFETALRLALMPSATTSNARSSPYFLA